MNIPDLRTEINEVTLEHCSVLVEALGRVLDQAYGGSELSLIASEHVDPVRMRTELRKLFTDEAFLNLFKTDFGKGVILGAFIQEYIFDEEVE